MKNGIINVYKEKGYTSFDVCAKLRGILKEKKLGHTGTLDPMAEGVLPVCIGRATKLCNLLTDKPKEYVCEFKLGLTTDTQDITGNIEKQYVSRFEDGELCFYENETEKHPFVSADKDRIISVIESFIGNIPQLTPMYSARKVDGKKLYEYAREGKTVERKTVNVNIYSISDINIRLEEGLVSMRVLCEKGTYIRVLCSDIGEKLGCGAVMTALLRTRVDIFEAGGARKLSEIEKIRDDGRLYEIIISPDAMFSDAVKLTVNDELMKYVLNGNPLRCDNFTVTIQNDSLVRLYDENERFLALYRCSDSVLKAEILFVSL